MFEIRTSRLSKRQKQAVLFALFVLVYSALSVSLVISARSGQAPPTFSGQGLLLFWGVSLAIGVGWTIRWLRERRQRQLPDHTDH
jgi:hypothetical protein